MALLTIPDEATSQTYTVTGAQTAFVFTFSVFTKADLHFSVGGVELTQADFTLTGTLLDGGGYRGGTVTLNVAVSATTCILWRETLAVRTANYSPAPSVPVRDIDVAINRITATLQDHRRDILSIGTGGSTGAVSSVNTRAGAIVLSASDVITGFGTQMATFLAAGANITFSTVAGVTTISGAASGSGAVSSVAGRTGAVVLTASDVSTGFGTSVGAALAAGANVAISTLSGVSTLSVTGLGALAFLGTITASLISDPTNVKTTESLLIAISDETTALTTGTAKVTFRMPYPFTPSVIRASVNTVSSSGLPTFDVKKNGVTVFSTLLTINANAKTSVGATTPAVLSATSWADDDEITVDIMVAGTGAKGAKLAILGKRT